jgi:hypothetical protein
LDSRTDRKIAGACRVGSFGSACSSRDETFDISCKSEGEGIGHAVSDDEGNA